MSDRGLYISTNEAPSDVKHSFRWKHLSQVQDKSFKSAKKSHANQNITGYILDQCQIQVDGTLFAVRVAHTGKY